MNRGSIRIRGLRLPCHIGATYKERARPQDVLIDVEVELDLEIAVTTDDLDATLDYGVALDAIAGVVTGSRASLLEHLAGAIADTVLGYENVAAVTVEVGKAEPPVEQQVDSISVRIRRERR